jgi:hypothetical protein
MVKELATESVAEFLTPRNSGSSLASSEQLVSYKLMLRMETKLFQESIEVMFLTFYQRI